MKISDQETILWRCICLHKQTVLPRAESFSQARHVQCIQNCKEAMFMNKKLIYIQKYI